MIIRKECIECGEESFASITSKEYDLYQRGAFASQAFPNLTAGERELFFLSGICDICWDILFAEDDEDEFDYPLSDLGNLLDRIANDEAAI